MSSNPNPPDILYTLTNTRVSTSPAAAVARMQQLMGALGHPQLAYPTVHITGTKGKGSVGAMTAAMLHAAGYRAGLYASPHLQDFRERFRIGDALISEAELAALLADLHPTLAQFTPLGLTWFEATTALVLEYFRRQQVDIAIIEVGIGGRYDATNILAPLATAITSISYDHMALLGESLAEIAHAKAGIIKPDVPVISAPQPAEALVVIKAEAKTQHAPLIMVGQDWHYEALGGDASTEHFRAAPQGQALRPYATALIGRHQAMNATVALALVETLSKRGFPVAETDRQRGLMQVYLPGRLEVIAQSPLVILDSAHNGASAERLAEALAERFPQRPCLLLFGAKSDKDIAGMFSALLPQMDALVLTQAVDAKAATLPALAALAQAQGYTRPLSIIANASDALAMATAQAGEGGVVVVTGSLYLVGEIRTLYNGAVGRAHPFREKERTDVGT